MMTIPTLSTVYPKSEWEGGGGGYGMLGMSTNVQLRFPSATLDNVCPPSIQFKMVKPHIPIRLKMQGTMTP